MSDNEQKSFQHECTLFLSENFNNNQFNQLQNLTKRVLEKFCATIERNVDIC